MSLAQTMRLDERLAPLAVLAAFVARLSGVRAGLLAFLLGVIGSFGQAPFHLWPLTAVMLTVFVWQIDGAAVAVKPRRAAFWRGWCLGFGYFLAGLWWIGSAFLVDADQFGFLMPIAITILPAGLALLWGLIGVGAVLLWRRDGRRIALLASVFFVVEYARGHILTGFPWSLAGQVWTAGGAISQSASVFGVYGLTLLTLFAFMSPAALAAPIKRYSTSLAPLIAAVVCFAALFGLGELRLMTASTAVDPDVRLRIVQAQIDQREKWAPGNLPVVAEHYLSLTAKPGLETRTHIIWAEAALPTRLLEEPRLLEVIARTLGDNRVLLTGVWRRDVSDPLRPHDYNSFAAIAIINGIPVVAAIYDKVKLVPFGEYTPFAGIVQRIVPALRVFGDGYTPGPGKATVDIPGAPPVAPQICYEVVFPGFTPGGPERPGWIVNVTNDAWYRGTPGPYQLYNQARFRAIESGVPLARAASGGFSALVDPYGRAVGQLAVDADDVIDADLPQALPAPIYSLLGDAPVYLMLLMGAYLGLSRRRGRA